MTKYISNSIHFDDSWEALTITRFLINDPMENYELDVLKRGPDGRRAWYEGKGKTIADAMQDCELNIQLDNSKIREKTPTKLPTNEHNEERERERLRKNEEARNKRNGGEKLEDTF